MIVACLGDSITEGSPHWDSRLQSGNTQSSWQHWAVVLHPDLELRNFGIWGERTDQIAARFDEAVEGARALIVQGCINALAQGRPIEEAARDLRALVDRGLGLGLRVAICDVLPWNNGGPAQERPIRALNALIATFGVPLLPFHATLEDPEQPGRMKAEWTDADGDHPSVAGYRRLGELAFRLP